MDKITGVTTSLYKTSAGFFPRPRQYRGLHNYTYYNTVMIQKPNSVKCCAHLITVFFSVTCFWLFVSFSKPS